MRRRKDWLLATMADEERLRKRIQEAEADSLDPLLGRMPEAPPPPDAPEPTRIDPALPPRPGTRRAGQPQPGEYRNMGLAYSAASSFIIPVIALAVGGYLLDRALRHSTDWFAFVGVLVGMLVGVSSLMRVMNRLNGKDR
ncbi:MAG TPA: AtpZ/AtpI family protein [Chthonomonadales bacterium]|nr:AtpZ/AtpI family protein [Chthonomonadales bacterium]